MIFTSLLLSFFILHELQRLAMEDLKREAILTADFLSEAVSASVDLDDEESVTLALQGATRRKNIAFLEIYSAAGERLYTYQTLPLLTFQHEKHAEFPTSIETGSGIVLALHPIPSPIDYTQQIGTLVLGVSTEQLDKRVWGFRVGIISSSLLLLIVGNVIAWFIGANVATPVVRLSEVSKHIANGDLSRTATFEKKLPGEIAELAQSFEGMRESLRDLITHIRNAGLLMRTASDDIFMAVNQLASALEQQSASVLETTITMESITVTSRQITGNIENVVTMAEHTKTHSQKGVAIAEETMAKMQEIQNTNTKFLQKVTVLGEQSEKIGDVIQMIHEIADQTKLIAFNAALEAAGNQDSVGKRFNVVALEIRRLADTIIESTQEIETNILDIQQGVRELVRSSDVTTLRITEGSQQTAMTADWLRGILDAAISTTDEARQIAFAIQEQQTANEQILLALKDISDVTRQFVDAGNHVSKSADEMKQLAEKFHTLIGKFTLGTDTH